MHIYIHHIDQISVICVPGVFVGSHCLASTPGLAWAEGLWREDVRVPGKTDHRPTVRTQWKGACTSLWQHISSPIFVFAIFNLLSQHKKRFQNGSQQSVSVKSCPGVLKYVQILVFVSMVGERQWQAWLQTSPQCATAQKMQWIQWMQRCSAYQSMLRP